MNHESLSSVCDFCWGTDGLNLRAGEIGIIMGQIGSGKTALLADIVDCTLNVCDGNCVYFDSDASAHLWLNKTNRKRTSICTEKYSLDELMQKIQKCDKNTCLLVCDSIADYPSDSKQSFEQKITELKQVALNLKIPILVSLSVCRPVLKNNTYNDQHQIHESKFLFADLIMMCQKIKTGEKNTQSKNHMAATEIIVIKNRHNKSKQSFIHKLYTTALNPKEL